MNFTKHFLLFITATLFCYGGCQRKAHRPDLVVISSTEPESLDPAITVGENRAVNELFEGLVRYNREGKIVPGMASSWEISPDGKKYLFHLRKDAMWSNGTPLRAIDFLNAWQRALIPSTGCAYNYQFFVIKGAQEFANGSDSNFNNVGVKALTPYELEVTLKAVTPYFLNLCSCYTFFPIPKKVIEKFGDDWIKREHIVSNGPYCLADWRVNDKIVLKKNPYYWNAEHVALKRVEILPLTQANVAFNFYASGGADLLMDKMLIPPFLMKALQQEPDFHATPYLGSYFLRLNCSKPPFSDPRVRKAFALCVRPAVITKKIAIGGEIPAHSLVPPGIEGYDPAKGLSYQPERARQLLAEAGYPCGKKFPLIHYLYSESDLNSGIAVELQSIWEKELGVKILLDRQEWKVAINSMNQLDYNIASSTWIGDYPDPNNFLEIFMAKAGNNRTGWADQYYDQSITLATTTSDNKKRMQLLQSAEHYLLTQGTPIIPIFYFAGIQLYHDQHLGGLGHNILNKSPISEIYRK